MIKILPEGDMCEQTVDKTWEKLGPKHLILCARTLNTALGLGIYNTEYKGKD
jgi:hypothetical protein